MVVTETLQEKRRRRAAASRLRMAARGQVSVREAALAQVAKQEHPSQGGKQ